MEKAGGKGVYPARAFDFHRFLKREKERKRKKQKQKNKNNNKKNPASYTG